MSRRFELAIWTLLAAGLILMTLALAADAAEAHHCIRKDCSELRAKYRHAGSCKRFGSSTIARRARVMRCEIGRAAPHYRQSESAAFAVVSCETGRTYTWWFAGHHEGAWQFLWSTWDSTPYGHRSPYSPKWSTLAAMWMWSVGRRGEWSC